MVQSAVVKSYSEEKERSKLPGYVCTYDDYDFDTDDVPAYGAMAMEMGNKTVRAHAPHPTPRGTHFTGDTAKARQEQESFGRGIG